jgi:prepilin-type N-terminal cleavage/methylation domain-containing protein
MPISTVGNSGRRRLGANAGVTLLELIVVMTILALLAGLVGPSFGHWLDDWKLRGVADRLAQTIRYARIQAISQQRYVVVEVKPEEHRVRVLQPAVGVAREYVLPSDVQVGEDPPASTPEVLRVILAPSGSVEERTFWVRNRHGATMKVHMDFLLAGPGIQVVRGEF